METLPNEMHDLILQYAKAAESESGITWRPATPATPGVSGSASIGGELKIYQGSFTTHIYIRRPHLHCFLDQFLKVRAPLAFDCVLTAYKECGKKSNVRLHQRILL